MIKTVGLNGQWLGCFEGSTPGFVVLNVDETESDYEGVAYLFHEDPTLPGTAAGFTVPGKTHKFEITTNYLLALDPSTKNPVPLDQIKAEWNFAKRANVKGELNGDKLHLTWHSDTGIQGDCVLDRSQSGEPSELKAVEKNWEEYKTYVKELRGEHLLFRGQNEPRRLRTSYHRLGRAEMSRFVNQDIPTLYRKLSARTRHVFDIKDGDQNGAFLNLAQHHGYPTPLLDWTHSPYVAAFFAYRGKSNRAADNADKGNKVRIFVFDAGKWNRIFQQFLTLVSPRLHITFSEFLAIENERLIPQQSVTMITNVDDVESYIKLQEEQRHESFLQAVDLPLSERRNVVRELNYMGITAASMFPGLDGACEDLKERNFDF
jgi:hypothetical protein